LGSHKFERGLTFFGAQLGRKFWGFQKSPQGFKAVLGTKIPNRSFSRKELTPEGGCFQTKKGGKSQDGDRPACCKKFLGAPYMGSTPIFLPCEDRFWCAPLPKTPEVFGGTPPNRLERNITGGTTTNRGGSGR